MNTCHPSNSSSYSSRSSHLRRSKPNSPFRPTETDNSRVIDECEIHELREYYDAVRQRSDDSVVKYTFAVMLRRCSL
jgi:hypothetical protein